MKLLIAEDAPAVAQVVAFGARMNWPDCRVLVAGSGEEAIRLFEEENPDLVILDVSMPPRMVLKSAAISGALPEFQF